MDDLIEVTVTGIVADHGSIIVFIGTDAEGQTVTFGADHRPGEVIAEALAAGEWPVVGLEGWEILTCACPE